MPLKIVTADMRLSEAYNKITMCIFGQAGVGKTSLLYSMPAENTLCLDLEAGMKSVEKWTGTSITIQEWEELENVACWIGGPDPSRSNGDPVLKTPPETYSQVHYEYASKEYGSSLDIDQYKNIFVDSITAATQMCLTWAMKQPAAFSEKTGKQDMRGAYGLIGREFPRMLKHLQHTPGKNTIFVGGLHKYVDDDTKIETWLPLTEGSKIGTDLPFIVDQVISMSRFNYLDGQGWMHKPDEGEYHVLVCKSPNPWRLPAKDRSGNLEVIEEADLGKLMEKISKPGRDVAERLKIKLPQTAK
jgi:hypothetical protein